jgi:F-type H+-transporting ATPase subunit b
MTRFALLLMLALILAATFALAQEPAAQRAEGAATAVAEGEGGLQVWAWLNFAILAAGLAWIFRKNAVPYFARRAIGIRKGMMEAEDARLEADRRMAAVEARLAALPAHIQSLKDEALAEQRAEHERMRRQTAAELAKIRARAEQEIASAAKAARLELKRYTVELAIGSAGQKVRARMDRAAQDALVRAFVHDIGRQASRALTT